MDYEIITPAELKFIKRIEISRNWIGAPLTCEIVLCDRSGESSVTAMFEGVSELEIAKTRGIDCGGPLKAVRLYVPNSSGNTRRYCCCGRELRGWLHRGLKSRCCSAP
jgi:hypothetical protein